MTGLVIFTTLALLTCQPGDRCMVQVAPYTPEKTAVEAAYEEHVEYVEYIEYVEYVEEAPETFEESEIIDEPAYFEEVTVDQPEDVEPVEDEEIEEEIPEELFVVGHVTVNGAGIDTDIFDWVEEPIDFASDWFTTCLIENVDLSGVEVGMTGDFGGVEMTCLEIWHYDTEEGPLYEGLWLHNDETLTIWIPTSILQGRQITCIDGVTVLT